MLTEQEIANIEAGAYGVELITDTAEHVGPFGLLLPLAAAVVNVLKSDYLHLHSGRPEITTVTCVAGVAAGEYFQITDGAGDVVDVYFVVNGSGSDPSAGDRGLAVALTTEQAADEDLTAAELAAALQADDFFQASASGAVVTITDASAGTRTDAVDVDSGFTVAVAQHGTAANPFSTHPLPVGVPVRIPAITSLTLSSGKVLAHRMPPRFTI